MSRPRLTLFLALAMLCVAWAWGAFSSQWLRLDQRTLIMGLQTGTVHPDDATLQMAIADNAALLRYTQCDVALQGNQALFLAEDADQASASGDLLHEDRALAAMRSALAGRLACTPLDGKAWLDLAVITTYREGLSPQAVAAFAMSARVAPGESWLAQKRLLFALAFRPVLTHESLAIAQHDIRVLEHAHPNRLKAVIKAAQVASEPELYQLFAFPAKDALDTASENQQL